MKKLLGIFLLIFAIIAGFSGAASAASVYAPTIAHSTILNGFGAKTIVNSPGATIGGFNVVANTGGDIFSTIGSITRKSTTNIGVGSYSGNVIIL